MREVKIKANEAGQRFDKWLAKYMNQAPKSFFYKMLRKKNITLNGKKADGSERLAEGDEIKLFLSEETLEKFSKSDILYVKPQLSIIYEDEHILILNKPAGMLSQKAEPQDISMNEHILSYLTDTGQCTIESLRHVRPSVCNRLDRNTSGLIVAGKTIPGLQAMSLVLKDRSLHKFYHCITGGELSESSRLEGYLIKDRQTNQVRVTRQETPQAAYIQTEYRPLLHTKEWTRLEVRLITGRSHQIRAHLASIGHPIIGDYKYGDDRINQIYKRKYKIMHQLLHSARMEFPQINGELSYLSGRVFEAPEPKEFQYFS
ncbi:RluA family pseudouridine synthase [Lachnospiraceae bacterium ASD3451]|uniref:RluA family pseudouridine synthase n=1 Tax=Diplocloster agilis TaxID=2850323 RepID=UPI001DBA5BA6|nr:RluA family pseudouridine synthase [Diplocloster agilis]MBU9746107.1 RluA family pseudouridine synthase [Diplocloster agilis]